MVVAKLSFQQSIHMHKTELSDLGENQDITRVSSCFPSFHTIEQSRVLKLKHTLFVPLTFFYIVCYFRGEMMRNSKWPMFLMKCCDIFSDIFVAHEKQSI